MFILEIQSIWIVGIKRASPLNFRYKQFVVDEDHRRCFFCKKIWICWSLYTKNFIIDEFSTQMFFSISDFFVELSTWMFIIDEYSIGKYHRPWIFYMRILLTINFLYENQFRRLCTFAMKLLLSIFYMKVYYQ